MTTNGQRPWRVLIYGDFFPTGFGRICMATATHLQKQGYEVMGACVHYDGILPFPARVPFHICGLSGRDMGQAYVGHARTAANIASAFRPDIILSVQDFPYHQALRSMPVDWSVTAHVVITPVDGVPIDPQWVEIIDQLDGFMTISEFGVDAFRQAGKRAELCPPGVNTAEFHRLPDAQRAELRDRLSIPRDAFVVGVMAMNQGRKDFPSMIAAFAEAFKDVPEARLYLDCDKQSPAGWKLDTVTVPQIGLDPARVLYREDAMKAGITGLNERYNVLDLHMVIAHREGYGLPHGEAMATGIPSVSLDYCSGHEVIGYNERGWLVPGEQHHQHAYGTWGGAVDFNVNMSALAAALREAHDKPEMRKARGAAALEWVQTERTWTRASEAVEKVIEGVITKRAEDFKRKDGQPQGQPLGAPLVLQPAGITNININGPVQVNGHNADQIGAALTHAVAPVQAKPLTLTLSPEDLRGAALLLQESDDDD